MAASSFRDARNAGNRPVLGAPSTQDTHNAAGADAFAAAGRGNSAAAAVAAASLVPAWQEERQAWLALAAEA